MPSDPDPGQTQKAEFLELYSQVVSAPRGPHSPEPVNFVHLEQRCSSQRVVGAAWAAHIALPQTLSFPGLWPEASPGHKPSTPPTHLSFLKVRPWVQVTALPQPPNGAAAGGSEEKGKDNEGFPFKKASNC